MNKKQSFWRDYTFNTKNVWINLVGLFFLSLAAGLAGVLNANSLKLLIDISSGESELSVLTGSLLALLVILFQAFVDALKNILNVKTQNKIACTAKRNLLECMEKVPYLKLSKYHTGDLLTRLSDDVDICAKVIPDMGGALLVGASSCILALTYGFILNWKLTVLCLFLSPLAVFWSKMILPHVQKYAALTREKESEIRAFGQEEIAYIPIIKSFTAYGYSSEQFRKKFTDLSHARISSAMVGAVLSSGATIVGFLSFIGAAGYGAYLALQGELTVGTIVGFIQLLNYIVWPFKSLVPILGNFQNGKAARKRIREIEEIVKEEEEREAEMLSSKVSLNVCNMSFAYDSDILLENINLNLEGNQFVGVVGPSGCGKSTFLKLLIGLYQPTTGTISINSARKSIEGTSIRKYISYVPQDHLLISGTIEENIAYGKEKYDMDEVISAAKRAGIHEYISSLPEQYETIVEEKGGNFSGGQAQRIAIARALYKDAPVLILDEPTASLDKESRKLIIDTLQREAKKKLCIMLCHDQTENSQIFDSVLLFENGMINKK